MDLGSPQDKPEAIGVRSLLMPKVLLSILIVLAVAIAGFLFVPSPQAVRRAAFPAVAGAAVLFALLGVGLVVVAARTQVRRRLKGFLMLTGASAAGMLLCAVLHNVVYGLLIHCFGDDVWSRLGLADESFFFILALFVCPVLFWVGAIGSFVLLLRSPARQCVAAS